MYMAKKRLYRSRDDVMVAGVLAGIAEYFDHDPTLWRIAFILFLIATGLFPGVVIYLAMWVLVPIAPNVQYRVVNDADDGSEANATEAH